MVEEEKQPDEVMSILVEVGAPRTLEHIMEEAQAFKGLYDSWKRENYPKAGTPVYLVSKVWYDKYQEYIFFKDIKYGWKPRNWTEDHAEKKHPGEVTNATFLDIDPKNLKGTG